MAQWKSVVGYEGLYEVSDQGRVKSLRKKIILKQWESQKHDLITVLTKDGKSTIRKVHRLVANAFLPNPNNHGRVKFLDDNKHNSCANNLEWHGPTIELHGMGRTVEYNTWCGMKHRIVNPNDNRWDRYGGRGLDICPEWEASFETFYRDMGPKPEGDYSIERLDNNRGYWPDNCVWATRTQQMRNRRNNVVVEHDGKHQTVTEWGFELGIDPKLLLGRIRQGFPVEKLFDEKQSNGKRLSPEFKQLMRDAILNEGRSKRDVAKQFGVCLMTVYGLFRRYR